MSAILRHRWTQAYAFAAGILSSAALADQGDLRRALCIAGACLFATFAGTAFALAAAERPAVHRDGECIRAGCGNPATYIDGWSAYCDLHHTPSGPARAEARAEMETGR